MNRRSFLILSAAAAVALVLPGASADTAGPSSPDSLSIQDAQLVSLSAALNASFGPDLRVTALHQSQDTWYASLKTTSQPARSFWLKSYNGRVWGSLDWQPRRNSPALS
jgi:hypothetical protein